MFHSQHEFCQQITADYKPQGPYMVGIWEIEPADGGTSYAATARHWSKEDYEQHKAMGFEDENPG